MQNTVSCLASAAHSKHARQPGQPLRLTAAGNTGDWAALLSQANREGLTGIVYRRIQRDGRLESVPRPIAERLASVYYHTMRVNLSLMADLEEILQAGSRVGIDPVVLQGMALQGDVYPDPGERPMADIDLWIDEGRMPRLAALLEELHYRGNPLYPGAFTRGATHLDVHTHLFWADRLKSRRWLIRGPVDGFIKAAETFRINAAPARRLSTTDQVLYLGLHALKHNVDRLVWLVDIQRLLAPMSAADRRRLRARAAAFGLTRQLGYVEYLIGRLLGGDQAAGRIGACPVGPLASWVLRRRDLGKALPEWSPLILLTAGKGFGGGAALAAEMVFPNKRVLRQVFADRPGAPAWQLYLERLAQFGRMLSR